jgi:hypothetical protein
MKKLNFFFFKIKNDLIIKEKIFIVLFFIRNFFNIDNLKINIFFYFRKF